MILAFCSLILPQKTLENTNIFVFCIQNTKEQLFEVMKELLG